MYKRKAAYIETSNNIYDLFINNLALEGHSTSYALTYVTNTMKPQIRYTMP